MFIKLSKNMLISVNLSCGGSSSENCTYIELASTSAPNPSTCEYTICPCTNNICRMRLDFEVCICFTILYATEY